MSITCIFEIGVVTSLPPTQHISFPDLQGEQATTELNNKLAQFSENAMKFTMDGGLSAYDYKAEEDDQETDGNTIKALAGTFHVMQLRVQCILLLHLLSPSKLKTITQDSVHSLDVAGRLRLFCITATSTAGLIEKYSAAATQTISNLK